MLVESRSGAQVVTLFLKELDFLVGLAPPADTQVLEFKALATGGAVDLPHVGLGIPNSFKHIYLGAKFVISACVTV